MKHFTLCSLEGQSELEPPQLENSTLGKSHCGLLLAQCE